MGELLAVIALWLATNFELPYTDQRPVLLTAPSESLTNIRRKLTQSRTTVESTVRTPNPHDVYAFYHVETQTIFLSEGWSAESAADTSILVHEMVHHLQSVAGTAQACPAARERLAFKAQDHWLRQFGTSLVTEFGIDRMTRLALSICTN